MLTPLNVLHRTCHHLWHTFSLTTLTDVPDTTLPVLRVTLSLHDCSAAALTWANNSLEGGPSFARKGVTNALSSNESETTKKQKKTAAYLAVSTRNCGKSAVARVFDAFIRCGHNVIGSKPSTGCFFVVFGLESYVGDSGACVYAPLSACIKFVCVCTFFSLWKQQATGCLAVCTFTCVCAGFFVFFYLI